VEYLMGFFFPSWGACATPEGLAAAENCRYLCLEFPYQQNPCRMKSITGYEKARDKPGLEDFACQAGEMWILLT